jgi:hypothetical protein
MNHVLSATPTQVGIQTGDLNAEAQRRRGVAWSKAPVAKIHGPVKNAAGAETRKSPLLLCVSAFKSAGERK